MSFIIGGTITQTTILRGGAFEDAVSEYKQMCMGEARRAGLAYLENETGYHTPVDTGNLIATAGAGENQYSVWFTIAGTLPDPFTGKQKPYGAAQEFGWHDRGGGFHPGWHMVEDAGKVAAEAYIAFAGGDAMSIFRDARLERYVSAGEFGSIRGVNF